jgi:predicted DNA-binding transcriptional regulator AlpA
MSEPLLTARELAERLGISTGALLRWTRKGRVPGAVKLPSGAIRYAPGRIAAWLEAQEMAGDGPKEVSPTSDAARRSEVSLVLSPISPRSVAAQPKEEHDGRT